jgi:hypothetical protein
MEKYIKSKKEYNKNIKDIKTTVLFKNNLVTNYQYEIDDISKKLEDEVLNEEKRTGLETRKTTLENLQKVLND